MAEYMYMGVAEPRDYPLVEGDIIMDYKQPLLKSLLYPYPCKGIYCSSCFKVSDTILKCKLCGFVFYCNEKCLIEDWNNGHRTECYLFNNLQFRNFCSNLNSCYLSIMLRCHAWKLLQPEWYEKLLKSFKSFNDEARGTRSRLSLMPDLSSHFLRELKAAGGKPEVHEDELRAIVDMFHTHKVVFLDDKESEVMGLGMYVEFNAVRHSCKPTALYINKGSEMELRAIAVIPAGQPPTISHVLGPSLGTQRGHYLREVFDIQCGCEYCRCPESSDKDFKKLAEFWVTFNRFRAGGEKSEWDNVLMIHQEMVVLLESLFHKYDRRVTNCFMATLEVGMEMSIGEADLKDLLIAIIKHMNTTYGTTYPLREAFYNSIAVRYRDTVDSLSTEPYD